MSVVRDCSGCAAGNHPAHREHEGLDGVLGGVSCPCTGDCAERAAAASAKVIEALGWTDGAATSTSPSAGPSETVLDLVAEIENVARRARSKLSRGFSGAVSFRDQAVADALDEIRDLAQQALAADHAQPATTD